MTNYFTSDSHFGHARIIELAYRDAFSTVDEMNEGLIERWNSVVQPDDHTYHMGDFAMGQKILWPSFRSRLNGTITFTRGNHDTPDDKFLAALLPGDRVLDEITTTMNDIVIHMAHAPVGWAEGRRDGHQVITRAGSGTKADLYLCGHVHGQFKVQPDIDVTCVNVGVDQWDMRPITLDEILACAS